MDLARLQLGICANSSAVMIVKWNGSERNKQILKNKVKQRTKSNNTKDAFISWSHPIVDIKSARRPTKGVTTLYSEVHLDKVHHALMAMYPVSALSIDRVVYYVVMEANLGIMSCYHGTYPSRHYVGCCLYRDWLEFYRVVCNYITPFWTRRM